MNRFIGVAKVTFQRRSDVYLADVSVGCVYLLSFYYLWHTIYAGRADIAGISLASMIAYTLVSTLIGFIVRQDVNIMVGEKIYEGDKSEADSHWGAFSPLVAVLLFAATYQFWKLGLKSYQGTGS